MPERYLRAAGFQFPLLTPLTSIHKLAAVYLKSRKFKTDSKGSETMTIVAAAGVSGVPGAAWEGS